MSIWTFIAGVAVVMSALNTTPQLIKSYRTKQTRDLSWVMLGIIMTGNVLWIAHGLHVGDPAIWIANVVLLGSTAVLASIKARYH